MPRVLVALSLVSLAFAVPVEAAPKKAKHAPAAKAEKADKKAKAPSAKGLGKIERKLPERLSEPAEAQASPAPTRGPTRIDFDDRLIQGQTNRSGAVYLYERKELKVRSMLSTRESFRDEIVGSLDGPVTP